MTQLFGSEDLLDKKALKEHCAELGMECSFFCGIAILKTKKNSFQIHYSNDGVKKMLYKNRDRFIEVPVPEELKGDIFGAAAYLAENQAMLAEKEKKKADAPPKAKTPQAAPPPQKPKMRQESYTPENQLQKSLNSAKTAMNNLFAKALLLKKTKVQGNAAQKKTQPVKGSPKPSQPKAIQYSPYLFGISFTEHCKKLGVKCGSYKNAIILEKDGVRYQVFHNRGIVTKIIRKENKGLVEIPLPASVRNDIYAIAKYIATCPIEVPKDTVQIAGDLKLHTAINREALQTLDEAYSLGMDIPAEEIVPVDDTQFSLGFPRKKEAEAGIFKKKFRIKRDNDESPKQKVQALEGLPERALFLGGHITLVNKVKELHPEWTFLTDDEFIRGWRKLGFMYVFYWTAHSSHAMKYYTEARLDPDAKIIYVSATNLTLLEEEMLQGFNQVQQTDGVFEE